MTPDAIGRATVDGPSGVAFSESVHSADETSAIALSMRDARVDRTWSVQVERVVFADAHEMFTGSVTNSAHRQVIPRVPLACGAQYTLTVRGGAYQDVPTNADGTFQAVAETQFRVRTRDNAWTTIDDRPSISGGLNRDVAPAAEEPRLHAVGDTLYAAWSEREDTGTAYRVRVNRLISPANGRNWVSDDGVLGADGSATFGLNRSAGQTGRMPKLVVVPRSTMKTPWTPGVHRYQSLAWVPSSVDRIAAVWSEGTLVHAAEAQGCD